MGFVADVLGFGQDDPPPPPDPYAVADAQGTANLEAARLGATLSRYDQKTPWGSLNWEQAADSAGLPTDKWTSTTTLDPRAQALVDAGLDTSLGLSGATQSALSRVDSTYESGLNTENLPDPGAWDLGPKQPTGLYDPSALVQPRVETATTANNALRDQLGRTAATAGQSFNYNALGAMPTADNAARQSVEDALYSRMTSRLDPQYAQTQAKLESQLTNQGITQGSEAWNTEMQNLGRNKNDAYQTAMETAIMNGGTEMQRQFDMNMTGRQQGVTEANTLRDRPFVEAGYLSGLNTAADSSLGNALTADTAYSINSQAIENAARDQAMQERAAMMAERSQGLTEQYTARNQVMNELNALRTGAQVTPPQFAAQQTGAQVGAAPVAQSVYNSYAGDQANYSAGVNSQNSMFGDLASLGGAAMMAPIGTFSDRRLKTAIKKLFNHPAGFGIYEFEYHWSPVKHIGIMAQEVKKLFPATVGHIGRYLAVDYRLLEELTNG